MTHDFSLYLHIPYCRVRCPYCDFNVSAVKQRPEAEYTRALIAELEHYATRQPWRDGSVATIYFGGGTPSLFAADSIASVLAAVRRLWKVGRRGESVECGELGAEWEDETQNPESRIQNPEFNIEHSTFNIYDAARSPPHPEVTLEANPGTLDLEKLRVLRAAGINRLSLGVQSFAARHLATLGRDHTAEEGREAVALAHAAGFDNVSLDLIFAVPGQTLADWEADIHEAVALVPDHISAYSLTYERKTRFHAMRARGDIVPVSEEDEAAMFTRTEELLKAGGYRRYEISNYARPGFESVHNLNYWRAGDYLGVGCGAHSFSRHPLPPRRWGNERNPKAYMSRVSETGQARVSEDVLSDAQQRGEFAFLALRCADGLSASEFSRRFGVDFESAFPDVERLEGSGLLVREDSRWRLSARGLLFADSVFAAFL